MPRIAHGRRVCLMLAQVGAAASLQKLLERTAERDVK